MDEELQDKPVSIPDYHQVVGMIRRRRWHFLLPFFGAWFLVWIVSWVLPSTYRSGTLILVEEPSVPEKFVVSNIDTDIQQQLDSITQQILSRTRLLHIIDGLNLYAQDRQRKNPDALVEEMRNDIEIELVRGDDRKLSAFNIYYVGRDPVTVQRATNELANLFITQNLEQRQERSENTTRFLQDQLDQAGQNLAEQEARVRQFKDKHIGELPNQTQSNLQILGGLQSQLQNEEDALNRAKQQNTYMDSLLSQYRAVDRGTKSGGLGPAGLATIDQELDRLKGQLADLSSRYTDKHPDVRKTKEQIARTESMREKIIANMSKGGDTSTPEPAATSTDPKSVPLLELQSQLQANRAEIANRQAAVKEFQNRIGEYQGRLNHAPLIEQQYADITRDYDQSKANYDSLLAKKNQSQMSTNLEKTQQGEHFRMLDPPNLPVKPYKPNRLQMCILGLVVGLVLGGAVAVGADRVGGKVHTEREIRNLLPFDIVAEIPPLETAFEQASVRRGNLVASLVAVLILACMAVGSAITYLRG